MLAYVRKSIYLSAAKLNKEHQTYGKGKQKI